jgi:Uma2 family endonuclease
MSQEDPLTPKPPPGQAALPSDDGEPMETPRHRLQMNLLIDSLSDAWAERDDFYVGGNMFVYFSELQLKRNDFRGPDVFVVLDVEKKERKSWVAWEEGGRLPDVVIEVTSDSTRQADHVEKKRTYAKVWRLPAYFIFDPENAKLDGFQLDAARRDYMPIEPDERGDLPVAALGLALGVRTGKIQEVEADFLRWIDERGAPLPTGRERAEQEQRRAEHAEQAAERAEEELERLRGELGRLRSRE